MSLDQDARNGVDPGSVSEPVLLSKEVDNQLEVEQASTDDSDGRGEAGSLIYVTGWRLSLLRLCASLCMFLVNMEVSIIGTSLISITNDLGGFKQTGWVVTGYLVTYTGLLIIWAKISDVYGRKMSLVISILIFTIFSGACGAAQTIVQLIVCRVFQGVGAAGTVSLSLVVCYEMVPKEQYPFQAALIGSAIALGSLVGPLIGGGVSEYSTWRWVFLINVPAGVVTCILLLISMPANFPYPEKTKKMSDGQSMRNLGRLDWPGAFLLLGATILLVTALLEGGSEFAWKSGTAISLIILSVILFIVFLVNERLVTRESRRQEPVFPWRFLFNRAWMGTLLISFLSGVPYNIIVIDLPQRFQAIDSVSPFGAGLRLIPFNFSISFASIVVNIIAKSRIPPIVLLMVGSIIQLVGMVLLSTLPENGMGLPTTIYGYEVLTGFGMGFVMGICLLLPPAVVEPRDLATSSGSLLQFRVLGGALGLAYGSAIMNNYLPSHLAKILGPERLASILQSTQNIQSLPPPLKEVTVAAFAHSYNFQMKVNAGFSALQVLAVLILWKKKQISVVEKKLS